MKKVYIEAPARLEIIGNHQDHQKGLVLTATIDLALRGESTPRDDSICRIESEGYGLVEFKIGEEGEKKKSFVALALGVIDYFKKHGYFIRGFEAKIQSTIKEGSGLSSSAAYSLFIGETLNVLFNGGMINRSFLIEASRYAENFYLHKASGFLDPSAIAYGGFNLFDFKKEKVEEMVAPLTLPSFPFKVFLFFTPIGHQGLEEEYSRIPLTMKKAAEKLNGVETLGELPYQGFDEVEEEKLKLLSPLERDYLKFFFEERKRVKIALSSLQEGKFLTFLKMIEESEKGQLILLKNQNSEHDSYENSLAFLQEKIAPFLNDIGASRGMGGGFSGSLLVFVEERFAQEFEEKVQKFLPNLAKREVNFSFRGLTSLTLEK